MLRCISAMIYSMESSCLRFHKNFFCPSSSYMSIFTSLSFDSHYKSNWKGGELASWRWPRVHWLKQAVRFGHNSNPKGCRLSVKITLDLDLLLLSNYFCSLS